MLIQANPGVASLAPASLFAAAAPAVTSFEPAPPLRDLGVSPRPRPPLGEQ